jgi:L-fucose mutarotase/ribose pyranase (RbsD/FucU family)
MRNIGITLGPGLLLVLAAIGLGGTVAYFQQNFPATICMVLDVIGLCK